jgi:hypothetical protein
MFRCEDPSPGPTSLQKIDAIGGCHSRGQSIEALVIIHRDTIETKLCESGLTSDCVCYPIQDNAFILSKLFTE